eukprot:TRINITY_DN18477_c0_g1_i1.p1 TRINITY_DN18477_c0_g1~~TRINITY_DN18477_c0_g1_i1.p1  ORF type:complete len:409 (+),score=113.39 TRINITY_DN18477_c0_g1_i1:298-1524(+)
MPPRRVRRRTAANTGTSVADDAAADVKKVATRHVELPSEAIALRQALPEMDGGVIAETLARVLVRLSYCDMHSLIVDTVVYLGQGEGVPVTLLYSVFGTDTSARNKRIFTGMVDTLAAQGILHKIRPLEENESFRFSINYLWIFYLAEKRYREVMDAVEVKDSDPTTEYICLRCGVILQGQFAIFELQRNGDEFYCKRNGCSGRVDERPVKVTAEKIEQRALCEKHLAIIRVILEHQRFLYAPKGASVVICSSDILSEQQYKAFQEQNALNAYASEVMQIRSAKKKSERTVEFTGETVEQRLRREYEEARLKQRSTAEGIPWVRRRHGLQAEEGAAESGKPVARKRRKLTELGRSVVAQGGGPRVLQSYSYAFYAAKHGAAPATTNDSYVSLSQYFAEQELQNMQDGS